MIFKVPSNPNPPVILASCPRLCPMGPGAAPRRSPQGRGRSAGARGPPAPDGTARPLRAGGDVRGRGLPAAPQPGGPRRAPAAAPPAAAAPPPEGKRSRPGQGEGRARGRGHRPARRPQRRAGGRPPRAPLRAAVPALEVGPEGRQESRPFPRGEVPFGVCKGS
ncbi:collagen alpha-1(I) chain-like isoform X1 [Passer domesticus]|uniref:collagen alpha-1(I) chain-like isoform X1 n=1 Tax=Passer domesticus TaxID=48849 RepID=UPI0030FE6817